jgi:hypothetical protein
MSWPGQDIRIFLTKRLLSRRRWGEGEGDEGRLLEQVPKDQFSCRDSKARTADVSFLCGSVMREQPISIQFPTLVSTLTYRSKVTSFNPAHNSPNINHLKYASLPHSRLTFKKQFQPARRYETIK